ncbi:MAG: hypothetical protein IJF54_00225 [Clostridia bacterium]|nr:hypothetical protein [Clostridia bacterium]
MKKINFSATALMRNNRVLFIFSLICAIAIWISVSPTKQVKIPVTVNIATENTAVGTLGLQIIEGQGQSVDVEVQGEWYVLSRLTEKDIKITVDMEGVTKAGDYELKISATKATSGANFSIVKVVPDKLKVNFDYTLPKIVPIIAKAEGIKVDDKSGLRLGTVRPDVESIEITGPQSVVDTIDHAVAEVTEKATLDNTGSYKTNIKFINKKGEEVDASKLTLPFNEVNVVVPVNKPKTLSVVVSFSNQPEYFKNSPISYTLSEDEINVLGPPDVIDTLNAVDLGTINFKDISPTNNTFTYKLNLPTGVEEENDISEIVVTVDTSRIRSRTLDVSKFVIINKPSDKTVTTITNKKTVTIAGVLDAINSIKASDLYLEFDYNDLQNESGESPVAVTLKSDKYNNVWGVGDYQIQIKVE